MYEKTTTLSLLKKINILAWVVVYLIIFAQPVLPEKQPDNIKQCFTCFLKKFSDWTWEQEKRLGMREDPKYITVADTNECKQRVDNRFVYTKVQTILIN